VVDTASSVYAQYILWVWVVFPLSLCGFSFDGLSWCELSSWNIAEALGWQHYQVHSGITASRHHGITASPWSRCMLAVILGGSSVMKKPDWHLKFDILQFWIGAATRICGGIFLPHLPHLAFFLCHVRYRNFFNATDCFSEVWVCLRNMVSLFFSLMVCFCLPCFYFVCAFFFPSENFVLTRQCGILCVAGVSFWLGTVVSCA
jgi:hypothetical protein